jgi:transcriptional regulator with XRE-family HTH domain
MKNISYCQENNGEKKERKMKKYEEIGKTIKILRKKAGISQEKLAKFVGISDRTLQRIEKGEGDLTLKTAKKIADALGVSFYELVGIDPLTSKIGKLFENAQEINPKSKINEKENQVNVVGNANIVNSTHSKVLLNESVKELPPEVVAIVKYMMKLTEDERLEFMSCIFSNCKK